MNLRRNRIIFFATVISSVLIAATGCERDPKIIDQLTEADIKFYTPSGFPNPVYDFDTNPVTVEGFQLGRKLFYDPRLSRDNTISCGTCHQQPSAFANTEHNVSHGIDGQFGTRNAPGLWNLAWHNTFMWDGGINHLEVQPLGPIANPVEMDEDVNNVLAKLRADAEYPRMFRDVFGDDSITTQRMLKAIAQFQGLMISADSKYDQYTRGEAQLTAQELNGLAIFRTKCASCHTEPLFTDRGFHNNGLPPEPTVMDIGRMHITNDPADSLKFATPSLRNIAITGPYMHDGRFTTLMQCLDHYTGTMHPSPTLDPLLTSGIALSASDKADLIAFLETLTDFTFISDPKFAEP